MPRYFIELSYKGTAYSGFQVQENAVTVQSEVEKAFATLHRHPVVLTGSSRTDAGVHALQNFFHFDAEYVHPQFVYKMNAILPEDISILALHAMGGEAHSRFDATSRRYEYRIHRHKNAFLRDRSYYFPYALDRAMLDEAASYIGQQTNFFAFAKTNSQAKHYRCTILRSEWKERGEELIYTIEANRFLRGMVRLITGTLLKVGRGKMEFAEMEELFRIEVKSGLSVPSQGLFLCSVSYPENYFPVSGGAFTGF